MGAPGAVFAAVVDALVSGSFEAFGAGAADVGAAAMVLIVEGYVIDVDVNAFLWVL